MIRMEKILFWKNINKIADGCVSEEPSSQANNSLQAINMDSKSIMNLKENDELISTKEPKLCMAALYQGDDFFEFGNLLATPWNGQVTFQKSFGSFVEDFYATFVLSFIADTSL